MIQDGGGLIVDTRHTKFLIEQKDNFSMKHSCSDLIANLPKGLLQSVRWKRSQTGHIAEAVHKRIRSDARDKLRKSSSNIMLLDQL